jgi:hypothetical protein
MDLRAEFSDMQSSGSDMDEATKIIAANQSQRSSRAAMPYNENLHAEIAE